MPEILIQGLSQEELDALESRATRHGRSVEEELMHLIHEAAGEERLVLDLERATQKVDAALSATRELATRTSSDDASAAAVGDSAARAPMRRRYRPVEPTRNR